MNSPKSRTDFPETTHDHVIDQLLGKSWQDMEVLENQGQLLFPESLWTRKTDGSFKETKILVKVPRAKDFRDARIEARKLAVKEGLDLKMDADLVENMENMHMLSLCMLNPEPPAHERWDPFPESLEKRYDMGSLSHVYNKIDKLSAVVDPRPDSISKVEILALIASLAKEQNISPLLAYGMGAQDTCIVTMASMLQSSLAPKSSSEPSGP